MKLRVTRIIIFCALLSIVISCSFLYVDNVNIQHEKHDDTIDQATSNFAVASDQDGEPSQPYYTTYGGPNSDSCTEMINTSDGGFAFVGLTQSYGGSDQDGWMVRTDANGNHLWNMTLGGSSNDNFRDVVECADGGFAIVGTTDSYGPGSQDVWLVKTDMNGNHLWNKTYGGISDDRGRALIECSSGGFAIAGYRKGTGWNGWLIRTNDTGDVEWTQSFVGSGDQRFEDIVECANGDFAMAGWMAAGGNERYWLLRANSAGTQLWSREYNPLGNERCNSVIECSTGGFALAGWAYTADTDGQDAWLIRTDSSGIAIWNQTYGGPGTESASNIIENDDGGFTFVGSTTSWGEGSYDAWIVTVNPTGHQIWNTTRGDIGSDGGTAVVHLDPWGYVLVGTTASYGAGSNDVWMVQLEPPLDLWNCTFGSTDNDAATAVIACSDGGYAMAGHTWTSDNDGQIWLVRIDSNGHRLWMQNYTGQGWSIERCTDLIECENGGFAMAGRAENSGWLLRIASDGTLLWHKYYDPGGGSGLFNKVIECSDGGFAMTGTCMFGGRYLWAVKTNNSGDTEWNELFHLASAATGYDLVECSDHGFAIAGIYEHTTTTSYLSGWLLRLNSDGSESWSKLYDTSYDDYLGSIILLENGDFILSGWRATGTTADTRDGWIMRTDSSGNTIWQDTYGGDKNDSFGKMIKCSSGSIAVIASTASYSSGDFDVWLLRFDLSGQLLWQQTYGGSGDDYGSRCCESPDGGYVLCGYTASFGAVGYDAYYLRVMPVRWMSSPQKQVIEYGMPLEYDLNVLSDYGVSSINFSGPVGFSMSRNYIISNTSVLSPGNYTCYIQLNDTFGDYLNDIFECTIEASAAPTWDETPEDQIVELGTYLYYDLNASDLSGIGMWGLNDTDHFSIDEDGVITSLYSLLVASYGLEVWVSDTLDNTQIVQFTVIVTDSTSPSWNEPPKDSILELGSPFVYDLNASDLSGVDFYYINDTANFQVDITGVISNVSLLTVTTYGLEVRAYDPYGSYCTAEISVTVEDTADPNWVNWPQNRIAEYGMPFVYIITASDLSGIESYSLNDTTYFHIDDSTGVMTNTTSLVPLGIYRLEVRAFDPYGHYCAAEFTITVQDTTAPEWVDLITNQYIGAHDILVYDLNATDPSGLDTWWINNTVLFTIDTNGVITNKSVLMTGQYGIQVRVNDTVGNELTGFFTVIVDVTAPTWIEIPTDQIIELGSVFAYDVNASDPSGIQYYWIDNIMFFQIDASGIITNDSILYQASYTIEVRAYDYYDNYCSATFVVTVVPPAITTTTTTTATVTSITTSSTTTVTSPTTTVTSPTTTTTSHPPTDVMLLIVIMIVGAGIAAVVVIIIILKRNRTS